MIKKTVALIRKMNFSSVIIACLAIMLMSAVGVFSASKLSAVSYDTKGCKELKQSLNISIPNIDLSTYHDERPLLDGNIEFLKSAGISDSEIALIKTYGDYKNIQRKVIMDEDSIKIAKRLYPDLLEIDMSKWTWGQYEDYYTQQDRLMYMPSESEAKEYAKRGITIDDAMELLGVYQSHYDILMQSDDTLKKYIAEYYENKLAYINYTPKS